MEKAKPRKITGWRQVDAKPSAGRRVYFKPAPATAPAPDQATKEGWENEGGTVKK